MVTSQEIKEREEQLNKVEGEAVTYSRKKIPERKYKSGVTKEQQLAVLRNRKEGRRIIGEVREARTEVQQVKSQAQAQAKEKQEQELDKRAYESAVKLFNSGKAGFYLSLVKDRSELGQKRKAYLKEFIKKEKRGEITPEYKAGATKQTKNPKDITELEGGSFAVGNRVFDKEGKELYLRSGIGLSPQESRIRDALIKANLLKEQSSANRLTADPLTKTYYEKAPSSKKLNIPTTQQSIIEGAKELEKNPAVPYRYFEKGKSTGQIIKQRFEQVGVQALQGGILLTEDTLTFFSRTSGSYGPEFKRRNINVDLGNLPGITGQKIKEFKQIKTSPEAKILGRYGLVYAPLIGAGAVSLIGGTTIAVTQSYKLKSFTPITKFSKDIASSFSLVNPRFDITKAFIDLEQGVALRGVKQPELLEISETVVKGSKTFRRGSYIITGERTPPKIIVPKGTRTNLLGNLDYKPAKIFKVYTPEPVINDLPFNVIEFRPDSNILRYTKVGGTSKTFNPNLEFSKLNKIEKYTLLRNLEMETGRPISLRKAQRDKIARLKFDDEPILTKQVKIKEEVYFKFFDEANIYTKGGVLSKKLATYNIKTRDLKVLENTGRLTSKDVFTSKATKVIETPDFEVYGLDNTFKNINNPLARATGKTPQLKGQIIIRKEPVILEDGTSNLLVINSKTSTSSGGKLKQLQAQEFKPLPKIIPKINQPKLIIGKTQPASVITRSVYSGLGLYELTDVTQARAPDLAPNIEQNFRQGITLSSNYINQPLNKISSKEISILGNRPVNKEITREITKGLNKQVPKFVIKEITKQTNKQATKQVTKQLTKQLQKNSFKIAQRTYKPPIIDKPFEKVPLTRFAISGGSSKTGVKGFKAYVIRDKKKVYLPNILPKGLALKLGETEAKRSLGATFGIKSANINLGNVKDIDYKPDKDIFRNYRIVKGKKVKLNNVYIQKKGKRLSFRTEVKEIQTAKRFKR